MRRRVSWLLRMRVRFAHAVLGLALPISLAASLAGSRSARADEPTAPIPGTATRGAPPDPRAAADASAEKPIDYCTERYEPAGFPLIGGDSDIGFEFGVAGTFSHFGDCISPYKWNMDLVIAASVKSGPTGADLAQQDYSFNWDIPGAFGGKVRLNPSVLFQRTVNYGYFGIGNATTGVRPVNAIGQPGRYNQYIQTEGRVRELTRFATHGAWNPVLVTMYRFEDPRGYRGSQLETDVATRDADGSPLARGLHPMSILTAGGGAIYDTRDNEFLPKRGQFHQLGLRFHEALPFSDSIRYGHASTIFAGYIPLNHSAAHSMTLAARAVLDAEFGHVPFFDMSTAGPFVTNDMPGGAQGVRGVPLGRYYGPLKAIGNVELRTMLFSFTLLSQTFHIGNSVFFDTGRLWSDYTFTNARDGRGLGLKWGSGVGAIIQWGQAAVFRVDAAYSPDALSANPGFPIGLYVSDGVMF